MIENSCGCLFKDQGDLYSRQHKCEIKDKLASLPYYWQIVYSSSSLLTILRLYILFPKCIVYIWLYCVCTFCSLNVLFISGYIVFIHYLH